jgi:radical SAM superfamily enzyme YgiQ (UPF0313 family)
VTATVVYIHPLPRPAQHGTGDGAAYPVIPVGLVGHLNLLAEAGHTVLGLNLAVERTLDPTFDLDAWLADNAEPAVVLIDFHWYEHAWGALDVARRARAAWSHTRIILGGLSATHFHLEVLEKAPEVDAVVCGAAEVAVLQLVQQAVAGDWRPGEVENVAARDLSGRPRSPSTHGQTPPELLDRLDTVDLSWLRHARAYRQMMHSRPLRVTAPDVQGQWILAGRGCAFACGYCGGGRLAHRTLSGLQKVARRDPIQLAADVDRLVLQGVQQVAPSLDPDMLGRPHRDAFFGHLRTRPGLYVESYQLPSVHLLDHLARSTDLQHTEVALTPLSGNAGVRQRHGKTYNNDQLLASVQQAVDRGIAVFAFFSLNLPGEDNRTVHETVALVEQLLELAPSDGLRAISIRHTLDPVSPMAQRPADFGLAAVSLHTLDDYLAYCTGPRPFTFAPGERGFTLQAPRDLPAMVGAWDALAVQHPGRVYAVPRV